MTDETITTQDKPTIDRRHDLDALRAIAMLLGVVLHGMLSFVPMPKGGWPAQDQFQSEGFSVAMAAVHGFRMPLFFLISGFFTAMLWRKRGLGSLIRHRLKRILLPLAIGMVTVIPVTWMAIIGVSIAASNDPTPTAAPVDLFSVATPAQAEAIIANATAPIDLDQRDAVFQMPAITHAVIADHPDVIQWLIDRGANVDAPTGDGSTALNMAVFLGRSQSAEVLIQSGANVSIRNNDGNGIQEAMNAPWEFTQPIAAMIGAKVDKQQVDEGRERIAEIVDLNAVKQAPRLASENDPVAESSSEGVIEKTTAWFIYWGMIPVFHHLWFLWFLCWLVAAFAIYAWLMDRTKRKHFSERLIVSPLRYAWLIPLTVLPQLLMGLMYPVFGPDTSSGLIPLPTVLFYYGIFFFFGALYFDCDDKQNRLGRHWKWTLPIALLVVFPIGYEFTMGGFGFGKGQLAPALERGISVLAQVVFAWLMTFGSIGLFRSVFRAESRVMRYVSDSSYWLYLAHLPLIMVAQHIVRHWQMPAMIKCTIVCVVVSGMLLLSYDWFVRYTPIGTLLNGPRQRPRKMTTPTVVAAEA